MPAYHTAVVPMIPGTRYIPAYLVLRYTYQDTRYVYIYVPGITTKTVGNIMKRGETDTCFYTGLSRGLQMFGTAAEYMVKGIIEGLYEVLVT